MTTSPVARNEESEITRAGVGGSVSVDADVGICFGASTGPRTTTGEVDPAITGIADGKRVEEMFTSASFDSWFGLIIAGRRSATVISCGAGATMVFVGRLTGAQITATGIGTTCRSWTSGGASG
jgi:hypothetical protein